MSSKNESLLWTELQKGVSETELTDLALSMTVLLNLVLCQFPGPAEPQFTHL